jgi:2,3-bisphosphoglycerate-independent phosphoglycerate mutase
MSADAIKQNLLKGLDNQKYQFIVTNFANADMVGHTGDIQAAVKALEYLDICLGEIIPKAHDEGWVTIITADHGNVEEMVDPYNGMINPEHTKNPVPFVLIPAGEESYSLSSSGTLADAAPTILNLLGLPVPTVMTGKNLIVSS